MKNIEGNKFPNTPHQNLLKKISSKVQLPAPAERRSLPINEMSRLERKGLSCLKCVGMCCTGDYNSMQVDPIQALELLAWLEKEGRLGKELDEKLDETIKEFRLDKEFSLGRGREMRTRYTCPFYKGEAKGCSVSRGSKPYGCLGFNPLEENVSLPGKCASNIAVLSERENKFEKVEALASEEVKAELGIYWEKKNLPFALKNMLEAIKNYSEEGLGKSRL